MAVASVLSVLEFATYAAPGGLPAEPRSPPVPAWLAQLVHLAAEVGILAVLLRNARTIDADRRSRQVLRLVVVVTLATYLVFATALTLLMPESGNPWGNVLDGLPWWFTIMWVVGLVSLAAPWALGITMLVPGDRSPATWLLAAAAPAYVATLLLPFVLGNAWVALPLSGVLTNVGLALLGARVPADSAPAAEPPGAG